MATFRSGWAVVLANILVPLGILVFSSGFFPYKPLLPGLATFDEVDQNATPAIFDKVIFMVVDALRRYVIKLNPVTFRSGHLTKWLFLVILSTQMSLGSRSHKGLPRLPSNYLTIKIIWPCIDSVLA